MCVHLVHRDPGDYLDSKGEMASEVQTVLVDPKDTQVLMVSASALSLSLSSLSQHQNLNQELIHQELEITKSRSQ